MGDTTTFGTKVKTLINLPPVKETGWHVELNIMDWGRGNQFDLRKWNEDGTKMTKGLTLQKEEVLTIFKEIKEEDLV